jgi:carboxypeptidase C (cathepsin A)
MLKKVLAIVGFAAIASAAPPGYPAADEVTELWQMPDLKFGLYSGYLTVPHTKKQLHYVAVGSKHDPAKDPVILWLGHGKPGCSSIYGLAMEHGPYVIEDNALNFTENQYSWNNNATVIYLDGPAGTGFSVCEDATECVFDDSNSGDDNLEVLKILLQEKFTAL